MVAEPRRDADSVRELLGTMGREVLARFRQTLKALEALDVAAAGKAVAEDSRTDEQELAVERKCIDLLLTAKPGRVDVNRVLAMIKISTDLERIADVATNIAECVEPLAHLGRGDVPDEIPQMSDIATEMLTDALDAFGKKDTVLAGRVRQRDDAMDVLNEEAYRLLLEAVARDPEHLEFATHYIVVSKSLERIADLCSNIAEHVIFMVTGEIVRHKGKP
ncbi:MAG TPA: phosphate signaling complex protein PhoU [Phycisphaerae bacterium]|nr:phosphate signaling complex protein PhoU [Phycisphaerae bacterium]